jgi:hypothetical protein
MNEVEFTNLKVGDRFHWRIFEGPGGRWLPNLDHTWEKTGASTYKRVECADERFKRAWPNWKDTTHRVGSSDAIAVRA